MLYLIHFEPSYKHARHYLGYTRHNDLNKRLDHHIRGYGNALVKAAYDAGHILTIALFIPGDRDKERKMKNQHNLSRFCPVCKCNHEVINLHNLTRLPDHSQDIDFYS